MRILKYLVTIFSSLFLIAGFINPAAAEEAAPPVLLASQPGLVVNQPPAEVSLGAKFSINGTIDPVKEGVTILRQTKKGEKWSTIGSTKSKADGSWNMSTTAPVKKAKTTYRIVVDRGDKPKSDPFTIVFKKAQVNLTAQSAAVNPANPIGFVGALNPPANKVGMQLQVYDAKKKKWVKKASSKTAADGTFNFTINASRKTAKYKYRVVTTSGITVATESSEQEVAVVPRIEGLGPNGRILGTDISRYQGNVNFAKMYAAGARFVFFKSSDGGPNAHARAVAYADLVISRWNAHGGYSQGTLPLVLDIEQAGVPSNVTDAEAVAFVKTWLEKVANATGKLPILYSNPTFLKNHLSGDPSLANYPLWAANYFDVSNPGVSPKTGCLNTVWTGDGCNLRWTFWQYSQTGPGGTFGVSSRGIDLNVFAGSAEELLALAGYPAAT